MDGYSTYEEIVLTRKGKLRLRFQQFQEFAKPCNLYDFTLRVSPESVPIRNPRSSYPPWQFDFFADLCKEMSEEERRRHFPSLKLLYQVLLLKYRNAPMRRERIMFLRRSFMLLLRLAESIGPKTVSSLITECKKAANVELCDFLRIVPVKDNSVVLRCFPTRRRSVGLGRNIRNCRKRMPARCFPTRESVGIGWDIHNSQMLIFALCGNKGRSVALIRFGYPYTFDQVYFAWRVNHLLGEESRAQIKGKLLRNEISRRIRHSGSLRLQMAVELLSVIFDETRAYDRNILHVLWRAVPFPYISSAEMSTLLSPFFETTDLQLQEVCDEYKKRNTVFEVPQVTGPRSLKHLSRVQVRKCMCDANTIGDEVIDELDMPVTLKDYLRLSFHEVYFDVLPNPDVFEV